jgi:FkbM family methyltransferase
MRVLKNAVQALLATFGARLVRTDGPAARATMDAAMRALARRNHPFRTVVDIGASTGMWSEHLMRHFPDRKYLLIEAQSSHEPALRSFCASHANAQYVLAAAGERPGKIFFETSDDPFGGAASASAGPGRIEVPVTTLDAELADRKLPGPYLLKFDTHGFEMPILKGAVETLRKTDVIVMECYNFRISPECLTFPEMCAWLGERGFRCIDLVEPMHRPHDDAFWQMDLVFARADRPEFSYQRYR